jgi:hypothetical protein
MGWLLYEPMLRVLALTMLAWSVSAGQPSTIEARINDVSARIDAALEARDRAALEPLIADPFSWIHGSDGRVDTRGVWLESASRGMALSGQRNVRSEYDVDIASHGPPAEPHTVVRTSRVRLRNAEGTWESWLRQTRVFVRSGGAWRMALGQGTLLYEGKVQDPALLARYPGRYVIDEKRALTLSLDDQSLMATFPNGARTQVFLASPVEEATRNMAAGQLRFTLGPDGTPLAASLFRSGREVWRGVREQSRAEP